MDKKNEKISGYVRNKLSNEEANKFMREIQNEDYMHIAEIQAACNAQLDIVIKKKNYQFSSDWDSDDFRGEVVLKMWKERDKFDESRAGFSTWISVLEKTVYAKHLEEKTREVAASSSVVLGEDGEELNIIDNYYSAPGSECEYFAKENCESIRNEIEKLPENQRNAIVLCKIYGYKPAEAAEIMECKPADISRWIKRGIDKIGRFVENDYDWGQLAV